MNKLSPTRPPVKAIFQSGNNLTGGMRDRTRDGNPVAHMADTDWHRRREQRQRPTCCDTYRHSPPPATCENGTTRYQATARDTRTSLLTSGFGVRVPGGAPAKPQANTTVGPQFCRFSRSLGTPRTVHFGLMASPWRLLGGIRNEMKINVTVPARPSSTAVTVAGVVRNSRLDVGVGLWCSGRPFARR
jgi:hypothetical protein